MAKSTSEGNKSSGLNKKIEAPETAPDLIHANSQRAIVRNSSGEITGFWFANPEHAHDEYHLRMAAAAEKDVDIYASIALKLTVRSNFQRLQKLWSGLERSTPSRA